MLHFNLLSRNVWVLALVFPVFLCNIVAIIILCCTVVCIVTLSSVVSCCNVLYCILSHCVEPPLLKGLFDLFLDFLQNSSQTLLLFH